MRRTVLLSSPESRCFFLLFLILRMASCSRVPEVVFLTFSFFTLCTLLLFSFISLQFYNKNRSFSFFFFLPPSVLLFETLGSSLVEGRHTSLAYAVNRTLSYSRANQDGVLDVPTLSHLSLYISRLFLLPLLLSSLLLRHPFFALLASEPGVRLTRWNFSTLFSRPCARISNSIVAAFTPALYFTCTLVSSLGLSVKPNLHGLLWIIIPNELSKARK